MVTLIEFFREYGDLFVEGCQATFYMVFMYTSLSYIFGLPLGIILTVTEPGSLYPKPVLHKILDAIVNIGRSVPFIILIVALIPFTRAVAGTSLGAKASVVPLVVSAVPFVARLAESSFKELESGVIEAAESMGASVMRMVFGVMIPESLPSLIRGVSLTAIALVGYSAMAGAVGGGGLGDIAIRYGYHRYNTDIMIFTLILLVLLVQVIQVLGHIVARLVDKQK